MSISQNRDHGQVPRSITTPDVVQSKIGRLEFADGYPTAETATRLRDEMNYLHGVQAFMNSIQGVSLWALRKGFADVGVADNEFILFSELMDSASSFLTANADTVYFWGNVNLAGGPMVMEAPPNVLGVIDDFWFRWVGDFGAPGPGGIARRRWLDDDLLRSAAAGWRSRRELGADRSRQGMVPALAPVLAVAGVLRQDLARRRDRPRRVEQPRT